MQKIYDKEFMKTMFYTKLNESLLEDWLILWKSSRNANYINAPQWFLSVLESFQYKEYKIVAVYKNNLLAAIIALVKEKKYGVSFYTVAPEDFVCGVPFLLMSSDEAVFKALLSGLTELGTVSLPNVPQETVVSMITFPKIAERAAIVKQSLNYYMLLRKDQKGTVMLPSKHSLMSNVKRIETEFTRDVFTGRTPKKLEIVFSIDDLSSKRNKGYNTFSNSRMKDFYKSLAEHFQDNFCVSLLYFKDIPIAYSINFIVDAICFESQKAFNEQYKRYAPGKVLTAMDIDYLAAHGIEKWDLGSGDYLLKRSLTQDYRLLYQMIFSKKVFIKNYMSMISKIKKGLYGWMSQNAKAYAMYRKIKNRNG